MQSEPKCEFVRAYIGACGGPVHTGRFCAHHIGTKCAACGGQATNECCHTGQFVCGAPLCDGCEGFSDPDKPSGTWGFMNHSHRMRGQVAEANPTTLANRKEVMPHTAEQPARPVQGCSSPRHDTTPPQASEPGVTIPVVEVPCVPAFVYLEPVAGHVVPERPRRGGPHLSHSLRSSDASTFDVICTACGHTDVTPGGWGALVDPCPAAIQEPPHD